MNMSSMLIRILRIFCLLKIFLGFIVTNKLLIAALAVLALPSLAACGGSGKEDLALNRPDTAPVDPDDAALHASIQEYLAANKGPKNSQYQYTRLDLNNDGLREGLVLFNLPHNYWCGWSGCTMAVFQAEDNNFRIVSATSRIRGPRVVGQTRTNGWEDIGVRLSGTEMADRNVLLKFDGTRYPENPLNEAILPYDLASLGGTRVFP